MSLRNGRLYQYLLDKSHCAPVALAGAAGVRAGMRLLVGASALLPAHGAVPAEAEARARVSAAFPKPALTRTPAAPPPARAYDLSIIAPVYNTGELLDPCAESVYAQETRYRYEIIWIDDGSDADTARRLSCYAGRADTVIEHRQNAGAAAARNRGLDIARGEYIMFLDADDLLLPGALDALMDGARRWDADFVQGGWRYTDGPRQVFPDRVYAGAARMELLELPGMPWGKVMRRALFDALRFPAGYTSYVDTPVKCLALRMAARCATVSPLVYAWRRNPAGITFTSRKTPRALQTYWIMEQMLSDSRALRLPEDALFRAVFLRQMTQVAYDRLKGLDEGLQRDAFALACAYLAPFLQEAKNDRLPFALRLAARAFERRDFDLWRRVGRRYALLC